MDELDFEMIPGSGIPRTNRDLAIISLHTDATNYLEEIDERARPIEINLLSCVSISPFWDNDYTTFTLKRGWDKSLKDFSDNFYLKYPEVEQIYSFSQYSCEKVHESKSKGSVSAALDRILGNIIHKRYLILPCFSDRKGSHRYHNQPSSDSQIRKTVERSLSFSSW